MIKEVFEVENYTKVELRKNITWIKKQVINFRNGQANDYEYEDYSSLNSWKDLAYRYIYELRSRGLNKNDKINIDAFLDQYYKAEKMLDDKLGWF